MLPCYQLLLHNYIPRRGHIWREENDGWGWRGLKGIADYMEGPPRPLPETALCVCSGRGCSGERYGIGFHWVALCMPVYVHNMV